MFLHLSVSHSVHRGALHRGGLHPRSLLPGFVCIQEGLHPGGFGQTPLPLSDTTGYGQRAGGTHHTGMHSCFLSIYISLCTPLSYSTTSTGSFREKVYFRISAPSLLPQSEFCVVKLISSR